LRSADAFEVRALLSFQADAQLFDHFRRQGVYVRKTPTRQLDFDRIRAARAKRERRRTRDLGLM